MLFNFALHPPGEAAHHAAHGARWALAIDALAAIHLAWHIYCAQIFFPRSLYMELSPGVTELSPRCHGGGNTKLLRDPRAKGWCFTLNNWTEEEYSAILSYCQGGSCEMWVIGKEIGEQGTPHLQGYIKGKNVIRLSTLKKICSRWHLEISKGSPEDNFKYCSKEKNFESFGFEPKINFRDGIKNKILEKKYKNVIWKDWQQSVLNIISENPDSRTINWFWEENGNVGKSFLCKYLKLTRKCVIADGKKDNVLHQICKMLDEEIEPEIVILDIPRHGRDYMNYGLIEQIKDGCIYSGKYEGGDCILDDVHIIVFANFEPEYNKFSTDRWNVVHI